MSIYSSEEQLQRIQKLLIQYTSLPFYEDLIPGPIMETILATVRGATVLKTYDFVDVIDRESGIGWQVKSTRERTPLTWKRAKISNQQAMIEESKISGDTQSLGDAVIDFCNEHILSSLQWYRLDQIGYVHLILLDDGQVTYFERLLCTKDQPIVFKKEDFIWRWGETRTAKKKEQCSALHGFHKGSGTKWWAWHGSGENQLHFNGEYEWMSEPNLTAMKFKFPSNNQMSFEDFVTMLESRPVLLPGGTHTL